MAQRLPYSRVVDVTVSREDRFPTVQGFQVMLIVGVETAAGAVDATTRTKLYSDMTEVAVDFPSTAEVYKAAQTVFSRSPRPAQIKIGYRNPANLMAAELDAIYAYDPDWYWLTFTKETYDQITLQEDAAEWVETRTALLGIGTADTDTENPASTAHISYALKDSGYMRTAGFYHTDNSVYLAQSALAYAASRNLDRANYELARRGRIDSGQAYTLKFKPMPGIAPINKGSAAVQAITGFVPSLGLDKAQGHLANTYVNIGGIDMLVEGNTYSGTFIDDVHGIDWIRARVQENVLGVLANNPRIPYTDTGAGLLINEGVVPPLQRAMAAGLIATGPGENGDFLPEWEISVDRVSNVLASQRKNRIAPDIKVDFRFSGAFHFVSVSMTVRY